MRSNTTGGDVRVGDLRPQTGVKCKSRAMTIAELLRDCPPSWFGPVGDRLASLEEREPKDGEDDDETTPPTPETIQDAFALVSQVQCATCALPSFEVGPDGNIEVSWTGNGILIEIEIDGSGLAVVYQRVPGFAEIERDVPLKGGDFRFVAAAIARLEMPR